MTQDTQTRWVVVTFGGLLILALTTLASLDRARIAKDASDALSTAQRVESNQSVLRAEVAGDVKVIREQLGQIQKQQEELLREMRRRR
jgi:predicted  nucleic acid-binding Zn-ribbon protein